MVLLFSSFLLHFLSVPFYSCLWSVVRFPATHVYGLSTHVYSFLLFTFMVQFPYTHIYGTLPLYSHLWSSSLILTSMVQFPDTHVYGLSTHVYGTVLGRPSPAGSGSRIAGPEGRSR